VTPSKSGEKATCLVQGVTVNLGKRVLGGSLARRLQKSIRELTCQTGVERKKRGGRA